MSRHIVLMAAVFAVQIEILLLGVGMWYVSAFLDTHYPWSQSWAVVAFLFWILLAILQNYIVFKKFDKVSKHKNKTEG